MNALEDLKPHLTQPLLKTADPILDSPEDCQIQPSLQSTKDQQAIETKRIALKVRKTGSSLFKNNYPGRAILYRQIT